MPELLVRTVDGENDHRYKDGDVVTVRPDGHQWGRMESLAVWLAEGRPANEWPGGFAVVHVPDLPDEIAAALLEEKPPNVTPARRRNRFDYQSLERRSAAGGRDTLRLEARITRSWADADVRAAVKAKE